MKDDWRLHQARLHMHNNHKFQSVYKHRDEPVFQQMSDNEDLANLLILITSSCVIAVLVILLALKYLPQLQAWLMS